MAQIEGVQNKETCIDIYIKEIVIKGYGKRFKGSSARNSTP